MDFVYLYSLFIYYIIQPIYYIIYLMQNNIFNRKIGITSADSTRKYTGVGVLILTNYNNKPHLVLGREAYKSIKHDGKYCVSVYEEFGGGIQKPSLGLEQNACFELQEETSNLLRFTDPTILNKGINKYFDIPFKTDRLYRIYVVYIENIASILPYFQHNRSILQNQVNTYFKYRHYLEMDDLKLVPLDYIKNAVSCKHNYICIYPEDNNHNDLPETTKYIGMLRVNSGTFISKRLTRFLNTMYEDNKSGLDWCYSIFQNGFINCKYYPALVASEKLTCLSSISHNPPGSNKLKFLDNTVSFDAR